jgi:hypothetical protein
MNPYFKVWVLCFILAISNIKMNKPSIDFMTMRENCIEIYQVVSELFDLGKHIGIPIKLPSPYNFITSASDLTSDPMTKKWEGMCSFAKDLHDYTALWNQLPDVDVTVPTETLGRVTRFTWKKSEALTDLLKSFYSMGGQKTYEYTKAQ